MLSPEEISQLKDTHKDIYSTTIYDTTYIWRRLNKLEYTHIDQLDATDEEKEELVCRYCILYPAIDLDHCMAGIPAALVEQILIYSGFDEQHSEELLQEYRNEMSTLESQMEAIIMCAYPDITLEDIEQWDVPKTLRYYSRAEWIMTILRGVPIMQILNDIHNPQSKKPTREQIADFPELRHHF